MARCRLLATDLRGSAEGDFGSCTMSTQPAHTDLTWKSAGRDAGGHTDKRSVRMAAALPVLATRCFLCTLVTFKAWIFFPLV